MMVKQVSESMSFSGWNIILFVKGHKKPLITLIGTGLGYFISGDETIGLLSGLIFAGIVSLGEYYFKSIRI